MDDSVQDSDIPSIKNFILCWKFCDVRVREEKITDDWATLDMFDGM